MGRTRRKTLQNVHVYFVGSFYYVPAVVRRSNGVWVEVLPVIKGAQADRASLASALQFARERSGPAPEAATSWDGEGASVWEKAAQTLSVFWYDDGTLRIVPKRLEPLVVDPEDGKVMSGGWVNESDRAVSMPADAPVKDVTEAVIYLVREDH